MTNNLFDSHSPHARPLYIWMGQIVDEVNWGENEPTTNYGPTDPKGWGKRYKIRVVGRDTQVKDVPDDQLEMAEVLLPVTAGSGLAGSKQTTNLNQGDFVMGFYKDGISGNQPCIIGCLPNNTQTPLFGGDPELGYIPRSGYFGKEETKPVATKDLAQNPVGSIPTAESASVAGSKQATVEKIDQAILGSKSYSIQKPYACDGPSSVISRVRAELSKITSFLNLIRSATAYYTNLITSVPEIFKTTQEIISSFMKLYVDFVRGELLKQVNFGLQFLFDFLPPSLIDTIGKNVDGLLENLHCIFENIMSGFGGLIGSLLEKFVDKFITTSTCAIESFIGDMLSTIVGPVIEGLSEFAGFIDNVLGLVDGALSMYSKITGALGSIFDIFGLILGAINGFTCEPMVKCDMAPEWNIWDGGNKFYTRTPPNFGDSLRVVIGSPTSVCESVPEICGPPAINISGGNGRGASGNAIIGRNGEILAVDVRNTGSNYTAPPGVTVVDSCGTGTGAVLRSRLGNPASTRNGRIRANVNTITRA